MSTIRLGAVGIGGIWNGAHATPLLANKDVRIEAVCDIVVEKARSFAAEHNIGHVFEDYRDLLKLEEIDAVDICTPNKFHSQIAVAALEAGKHVFVEKPDAINPAEARRMRDAAKASGKVLMAMRNNRFGPAARFLKKFCDAGEMGEVYAGRCGWIRRRGIPGKGGWFTTKALSGGGPLIDLGVHMIDLAMWLMGSPKPVAVSGATYRKFADAHGSDSVHAGFGEAVEQGTFDVEDLAMGMIRFDNGATLQLEFSWASNVEAERNFVELRGTRAGCTLANGELKIFSESHGGLTDITPRQTRETWGGHARALDHFIDVLKGLAEPIITPEQGVHMIEILSAIYESAESGREVRL